MSNLEHCNQNIPTTDTGKNAVMSKQVRKKADGRTIIFYSFKRECSAVDSSDAIDEAVGVIMQTGQEA